MHDVAVLLRFSLFPAKVLLFLLLPLSAKHIEVENDIGVTEQG